MQKNLLTAPESDASRTRLLFPGAFSSFFARERIGLYYDVGIHKIFTRWSPVAEAVISVSMLLRRLSCVSDLHFHR